MLLENLDDAKGYTTRENAIRRIDRTFPKDEGFKARAFIAVNSKGKFVPVVVTNDPDHIIGCMHASIYVTNARG